MNVYLYQNNTEKILKNIYIGEAFTNRATQGPCPDGFHVPLSTEWSGVISLVNSMSVNDFRTLKMPMVGYWDYNNNRYSQGERGLYWSSSPNTTYNDYAYYLSFYQSSSSITNDTRSMGFSIRPFKNEFVTPTSGWTVIAGTLGSAGIFWDQTDGLISITGDGTTGYTIADKNLGATTVYNYGDTLTKANMGNLFQRGNNYGFTSGTYLSKTSSASVDTTGYGPGNYYSSDVFVLNYTRSNPANNNLWGGVDGNVPV